MKTNPIFLSPLASTSIAASTALPATAIVCVPTDNKDNKSVRTNKIYTLLCFLIYLGILGGGFGNGVVAQTVFGPQQVIETDLTPSVVYIVDLDRDGDLDVICGYNNKVVWYRNYGTGNFGAPRIITTAAGSGLYYIYAGDIDGDGHIDVMTTNIGDRKVVWFKNDGLGNFGAEHIIVYGGSGVNSVYAADLDNDGDIDVLLTSYYFKKVDWIENDGTGNFSTSHIISFYQEGVHAAYADDVDGDGDTDILYAYGSWASALILYKNNGTGNFSIGQTISSSANEAWSSAVYVADLDNDGYTDLLSKSGNHYKIAWYKNNGAGNFGSPQIITTTADYTLSTFAADLEGDGNLDMLTISWLDDTIAWYKNYGAGNFGSPQIITTTAKGVRDVYAADLDGDGDVDVLAIANNENSIVWYENLRINPDTPDAPMPPIYIDPNPTHNTCYLTYTALQAQAITLHLYDHIGRLVFEATLQPTTGINNYELDMTHYQQGLYVVTLNNGAEVVSGKVVKQ